MVPSIACVPKMKGDHCCQHHQPSVGPPQRIRIRRGGKISSLILAEAFTIDVEPLLEYRLTYIFVKWICLAIDFFCFSGLNMPFDDASLE